jgi:phosphoglycolate phosphatase-like HAD superfamily hydrolase
VEQYLSDMPTVLLDCDGVIVDNVAFERRVTETIIDAFAESTKMPTSEAERRWREELSLTKGHPSWYDYAFHCNRLGLDGTNLARKAHEEAAGLLALVPGVDETLRYFQEYGLEVGVVTDAVDWVVKFKLAHLGLNAISFVFTSTDAAETKAADAYWERLSQQFEYLKPRLLVDNRQVNLYSAANSLPDIWLVQFEKQEHVMTLPDEVAPTSYGQANHLVSVIHDHDHLRKWLVCHLPELIQLDSAPPCQSCVSDF